MSGPPGCGKSLFAETFPSILPPLTHVAQLEVISLYQLAKEKLLPRKLLLIEIPIILHRPLRLLAAVPIQNPEKFHLPIVGFCFLMK